MDKSLFPQRQTAGDMALVDPAAVAAAESAKALIQASFIMAYQKPRNQMQSRTNILAACKRTEFADKAEYKKPMGKKRNPETGKWEDNFVIGPSIRFAELAIREWENVDISTIVLYEDDDVKRLRVGAIDLETNSKFSRDLQIKKTIERRSKKGREDDILAERRNSYGDTVYVLRATDEEMLTKESAWVSKIIRNEGLRLIPTDIIEEGLRQCRETLKSRASMDPEGEKKKVVDAFASIGVKPIEIEKYLGHSLDTVSPSEISDLRSVWRTIRDGEARWVDYVDNETETQVETNNDDVEDALKERAAPAGQVKVSDDGGSEPACAGRYNGANSRPPEGHTDGGDHAGPGQAHETVSDGWDPRTKPIMSRYVHKREMAVKNTADEMGIDFAGMKTNREIHWVILFNQARAFGIPVGNREPEEICNESIFLYRYFKGVVPADREIPEPETGDAQLSPRDRFVEALNQHDGADEFDIGDIAAYAHHVAGKTDRTIGEVYAKAADNIDKFVDYFKNWYDEQRRSSTTGDDLGAAGDVKQEEAAHGTSDDMENQSILDDLRDQLIKLRLNDETKFKTIVNSMVKTSQLPGTSVAEWTEEQRHDVIDILTDKF